MSKVSQRKKNKISPPLIDIWDGEGEEEGDEEEEEEEEQIQWQLLNRRWCSCGTIFACALVTLARVINNLDEWVAFIHFFLSPTQAAEVRKMSRGKVCSLFSWPFIRSHTSTGPGQKGRKPLALPQVVCEDRAKWQIQLNVSWSL